MTRSIKGLGRRRRRRRILLSCAGASFRTAPASLQFWSPNLDSPSFVGNCQQVAQINCINCINLRRIYDGKGCPWERVASLTVSFTGSQGKWPATLSITPKSVRRFLSRQKACEDFPHAKKRAKISLTLYCMITLRAFLTFRSCAYLKPCERSEQTK